MLPKHFFLIQMLFFWLQDKFLYKLPKDLLERLHHCCLVMELNLMKFLLNHYFDLICYYLYLLLNFHLDLFYLYFLIDYQYF